MMYSHWLTPGQGPGSEPGGMGCMVLRRTFHTAPELEQGPEHGRMGCVLIFQVLKLFWVVCFNDISIAFRCPVLAPGFCIISIPVFVPVPVPETDSVNTPLVALRAKYFCCPRY